MTKSTEPSGQLAIRTVAMPRDTNANGDIFGGWVVSHMDLAAGIEARNVAKSRVVTVAIDSLTFIKPVYVGDTVSCYAEQLKIGRTSIQFRIEVWTAHLLEETQKKVAEGLFTFVAIDKDGKPWPIVRE